MGGEDLILNSNVVGSQILNSSYIVDYVGRDLQGNNDMFIEDTFEGINDMEVLKNIQGNNDIFVEAPVIGISDIEVLKDVQGVNDVFIVGPVVGVNDVFINNSVVAYNDILVPAAEMQDKEDYANATGDWELIGYTVDWAENI
jgi:hypothetical protein